MTDAADVRRDVLERRARRLAQVAEDVGSRRTGDDVAIVRVGDREVALPAESVREIVRRPPVTELPAAGSALVGLTQVRGALVGVADLGRLLGLAAGAGERGHLALVDTAQGPLGLLIDAVAGFRRIHPEDLAARDGDAGDEDAPTRGLTRDLVSVLDLDRLLAAESLRGRR